jgi:hypothetical protein
MRLWCAYGFGALAMLLLQGCSGAKSSTSSAVSISISPTKSSVTVGHTLPFQATVTGSTNTGVTWQVNGIMGGNATIGTISTAGAFTAPAQVPNPASVSVTAVAQADPAKSSTASVLIVASNNNQLAQSIPIKLGTSGGNASDASTQGHLVSCCGGTLGALVKRNGNLYILSNNHVLARSDLASVGDAITQPGLIDANCSTVGTTTVGNLTQFVNLENPATNVDAAIAQMVPGTVDTTGSILSLGATATGSTPDAGPPHAGNGIAAAIGESVAKSGRTTGLTCATVGAIQVTTSVSYQLGCNTGTTFSTTFTGQVSVTFPAGGSFSGDGDSGSLIVDQNTSDPVALLYAASDSEAVGNPVADVLSALQDGQGNRPTFVGSASTHKVIGCSLAPANAITANAEAKFAVSGDYLARAERARDLHAPELLANPYVQAIGVGPSIDHPGEPAVLLFVHPEQIPKALPSTVEGVATRIVPASDAGPRGIIAVETVRRIAPVADTFSATSISKEELARAKVAHATHVEELMNEPGVQGVGITSSGDAPGEAALLIFVIRGVPRNAIPVSIDGVRTRIRESSRFTAGYSESGVTSGCHLARASRP